MIAQKNIRFWFWKTKDTTIFFHQANYDFPPPASLIVGSTDPKVRSSKAVWGRDVVRGLGGVSVVGVDVSQQGAHHCRHTWAHVLRWQAGKVTAKRANTALMKDGEKPAMHPNTQPSVRRSHTSWLGRWTPLRNAWRTRPRSPGGSPQSRPSMRHPLWRRGSSPPRCFGYLSQSGRGSTQTEIEKRVRGRNVPGGKKKIGESERKYAEEGKETYKHLDILLQSKFLDVSFYKHRADYNNCFIFKLLQPLNSIMNTRCCLDLWVGYVVYGHLRAAITGQVCLLRFS